MGKLVVTNHLTLDGVMQAPARPQEDRRGDFQHGGWAAPNTDDVMGKMMAQGMAREGVMLLGRVTYEAMFDFWPKQTDGNPYTEKLNRTQKYVASTTLSEPLPWENSKLLSGDVAAAVTRLKQEHDVAVLGSGALIRSLMEHGLVDEWLLMIHPLILGSGGKLFPDGTPSAKLTLTESVITTTGVVIARYVS
jgi:dihydrofolate reductase